MCKSKYGIETIVDVIESSEKVGILETAENFNIPYHTINNWRRVYNHPNVYPNHAITKYYANNTNSTVVTTPDKIEVKAENDSVDVELKVEVKREIKGSYEMHNSKQRSYMPEFKEFAVALAKKIGEKEAAEELGIRETAIPEWRSKLKWEGIRKDNLMKSLEKDNYELRRKISELKSENGQLRKYIGDNYIATILQN